MPCDYCYPDTKDYGFEMSDVRDTYYVWDELTEEEKEAGEEASLVHKITVRVERQYFTCERCEIGWDYKCKYGVYVDNTRECTLDTQFKANAYIKIAYPEARPPEPDYAWESERHLRIAEGWW